MPAEKLASCAKIRQLINKGVWFKSNENKIDEYKIPKRKK